MKGTLFSVLLLATFATTAQHEIKVNLKGAPEGKNVYLAQYFGYSQPLKKDSAIVTNGQMVFKGAEALPTGMYLIVLNANKYYEIILNEQNFEISSDTTDFIGHFETTSVENQKFYSLQKYISSKSQEAMVMQQTMSMRPDPTSQALTRSKIANIQNEVTLFKKNFVEENKDLLVGKYMKLTMEPELPTALPKKPDGKVDSTYLFYAYRNSFWDHFDFADDRLVRSPFLQKAIDTYLERLTVTQPDSIIKAADVIMGKAQANSEVMRYCMWYITQRYENSKVVGIEPVFIHMAEKYYLSGKASWLDSAAVANLARRIKTMKPLQIGLKFPDFHGLDPQRAPVSVNSIPAKFLGVIFYADDCGHCKEAMPKLVAAKDSLYKKYGLKFVLVDVKYNEDEWKKFINDYKIGDFVNLWDGTGKYQINDDFDVFTTPTMYILDEQKRIIVKKLPVEDLDGYMKFWQQKNKKS